MQPELKILRTMVLGAYDLQQLRIQTGARVCANFRAKLATKEVLPDPDAEPLPPDELSPEAEKLLDQLKNSYKTLTEGMARNRTLPAEKGFTGDELISTYAEITMVDQYIKLEQQEKSHFRQMGAVLEKLPIYTSYLKDVVGIGPAMAAVLVTYLDIAKARHVSGFWKYAGLDVGPDGAGRSRRAEHLIDREYTAADGTQKTKKSVTYNPWLKMKLLGALASSFMKCGSPWAATYLDYKHRLQTDPARVKVTVGEWKKAFAAGEETRHLWAPGRIHRASLRYMVKMFLLEFWTKWRTIEGLPVTPSYHEAKQGHRHAA